MLRTLTKWMTAAALVALVAGCSNSPSPAPEPAPPAAPAIPPELQQVAEKELGTEAEILAYGDLAKNGKDQVLVINRLPHPAPETPPGILLTRAVIDEKDGETWREVFLCDEHLKNPKGYLAATPVAPVAGWRLQYEQHADMGLVMYFTPLVQPAGGYKVSIGVRWNPKVGRYQSLNRTFESFLGENPALEPIQGRIR